MAINLKEALRIAVGAIRPEIRRIAQWMVDRLPPALRQEWIGRIVGALAQIVERTEILGIQESISDAIEIISDEIGRQVRERKVKKEEIDLMNELRKMLENARERLRQAENVEEVRDRIIAELQAYESILEIFKTIEERYAPKKEQRRIDWSKVGERIREIIRVINEQGIQRAIEFIRREFPEVRRGFREGWQRGRRRGLI